jgi:metal-responsive CopG/Arc/MetJ family transcriptional regulator
MKTTVSIPDDVFEKGEKAAKRLGMSRSELYAKAVEAYVDAHTPASVKPAARLVTLRKDS